MIKTAKSTQRVEEIMSQLQQRIRPKDEVLSDIDIFMNKLYYHSDDFYQYDDIEFVQYVYAGILKRKAEPQGLELRVNELRNSLKSKEEIVRIVRYSQEGIDQNVKIVGLLASHLMIKKRNHQLLTNIKKLHKGQ